MKQQVKYQVKKVVSGLLAVGLSGSAAACGVTSEVATHSSAPLAEVASEAGVSEASPGAQGRPRPLAAASADRSLKGASVAIRVGPRGGSRPAAASLSNARPGAVLPNRRIQSGRIVDEAGQPLVGATVLLQGTAHGASTDANGDYSFDVPLGTNTFLVAYAGYQDEVAQSRDGQPLTVTLLPVPGQAAPEPVPATPPKKKSHPARRLLPKARH